MKQSTIEFSALSDDPNPNLRRFFRVPVYGERDVSFRVSDIGYPVLEISQAGISMVLDDNQTFEVGERIDACRLAFDDIVLTGMTGKIVHCSPHENQWKFGIQWMGFDDSQKGRMDELVSRLKKRVLAFSHPSLPEHPGR